MNIWNLSYSSRCALAKFIGSVAVFVSLLGSNVHAELNDSFIKVQGKGEVGAVPDLATFSLVVSETNLNLEPAQQNVKARVLSVLDILKGYQIKKGSLDSSRVSINPRYNYRTNRESPSFVGYEVAQTIKFSLENLDQMNSLISNLGKSKIDKMQPVSFENSRSKELRENALEKAINHSKNLAGKIAKQYGVKLGKLVNAIYLPPGAQVASSRMMHAEMSSGQGGAYQQKELVFNATIEATFGIE